jgi:hypothetical protein
MGHQRWVQGIDIVIQPKQLVMKGLASSLHVECLNKCFLLNQYWDDKSSTKQ